jgi:hypothetical protein
MTAVPAKIVRVRIGTWNLEGRWSPDHLALMDREACDVWLLTEVHIDTAVPGMHVHRTAELMGHRKAWAAIFSTVDIDPQPDPHRATALAQIDGLRLMSSVLPWRTCGPSWPGSTLAEKQRATLDALRVHINETTIWGGDWNQALEGTEYVGSLDGRTRSSNSSRPHVSRCQRGHWPALRRDTARSTTSLSRQVGT